MRIRKESVVVEVAYLFARKERIPAAVSRCELLARLVAFAPPFIVAAYLFLPATSIFLWICILEIPATAFCAMLNVLGFLNWYDGIDAALNHVIVPTLRWVRGANPAAQALLAYGAALMGILMLRNFLDSAPANPLMRFMRDARSRFCSTCEIV